MELEEAIEGLNSLKIIFEIDNGANFEATPVTQKEIANEIKVVLNHLTKQEKMIESVKDRIEYYLMGNSTLNDFYVREKELEKLLNILKKAEEIDNK